MPDKGQKEGLFAPTGGDLIVRPGSGITVVPIGRAVPDPDIILRIEELLERAKTGDVRGLVYITQDLDGSFTHCITRCDDQLRLIGMLHRLIHRAHMVCEIEIKPNVGG